MVDTFVSEGTRFKVFESPAVSVVAVLVVSIVK